nr:hypothetical protein [Nostoc sp. DedQUE02]
MLGRLCEVGSALIKSAAFSAIMIVGTLVFRVAIVGMMDERLAGLRSAIRSSTA